MLPYEENPYHMDATLRPDYDSSKDAVIVRRIAPRVTLTPTVWTLERPLYDIRYDAYWLVTKDARIYWFTGPVHLSAELAALLPEMTPQERKDALRHAPEEQSVYTNIVTIQPDEDAPDGA